MSIHDLAARTEAIYVKILGRPLTDSERRRYIPASLIEE